MIYKYARQTILPEKIIRSSNVSVTGDLFHFGYLSEIEKTAKIQA